MLRDFRTRFRGAAFALCVAAGIGVAALAGCGIKGPLKPPQAQVPAPGAQPAGEPPATPAPLPSDPGP